MLARLFFIIVGSGFGYLIAEDELIEVNRIVARINDRVITWGEIELAMEKLNFSEKEKLQRAREFVDGKIDRLLSQIAFKEKGMELPETYVEQEYSNKLMSDFNGDRRLFREVLQSNGQSSLEYKEQLKEDIIHMHMLGQRKRSGDEISPQSVEDYYQQNKSDFRVGKRVKLSEIVFSGNKNESVTLNSAAQKVYALLQEGFDFKELASKNGQSPFIKNSGSWGFFVSQDEIRNDQIRDIAFKLNEGVSSKPFAVNLLERKPDGSVAPSGNIAWYIIKADKIEPAKNLPINEVRSEIEGILARNSELNDQRRWLSRQKRDAYVEVSLPD
jgi:parvulin-like peptidyl-prolyl isomerase